MAKTTRFLAQVGTTVGGSLKILLPCSSSLLVEHETGHFQEEPVMFSPPITWSWSSATRNVLKTTKKVTNDLESANARSVHI